MALADGGRRLVRQVKLEVALTLGKFFRHSSMVVEKEAGDDENISMVAFLNVLVDILEEITRVATRVGCARSESVAVQRAAGGFTHYSNA